MIFLLIGAVVVGAFLWKRKLSPAAKIKAAADDVRATGGPLGDQVGIQRGISADNIAASFGDAIVNGFDAPQNRAEARHATIANDVQRVLLARIAAGEYFLEYATVPSMGLDGDPTSITLVGSRQTPIMVRRQTDSGAPVDRATARARAVGPSWYPNGIMLDSNWQSRLSEDNLLAAEALALKPRMWLTSGGLFGSDTFHLAFVQNPTRVNTKTLYDAMRAIPRIAPTAADRRAGEVYTSERDRLAVERDIAARLRDPIQELARRAAVRARMSTGIKRAILVALERSWAASPVLSPI